MIRELNIKNLALIDDLRLCFASGLTVLTGETGAGKSIILQALTLLAGGRASATWVRSGSEAATVEGIFTLAPERTRTREELDALAIACTPSLSIKRTLTASGKSRYFINNAPATARLVSEVTSSLLSIAGQHDQQQLLNSQRHLDFIDTVGSLWEQRQSLGALFNAWTSLKNQHQDLLAKEEKKDQRRDYLIFQSTEIRDAAISPGEDEELKTEKNQLRAAETLQKLGHECHFILAGPLGDSLQQARQKAMQIAEIDGSAAELAEAITESSYQIEDLASRVQKYVRGISDDPGRLEIINERLDLLQRLKRKYGGQQSTLEHVLLHAEACEQELQELGSMEKTRTRIERELLELEKKLTRLASDLSAARRKEALRFSTAMGAELAHLCFDNTAFEVAFENGESDLDGLTPAGWDQLEFMFSANPGEPVKPLAQIASGGELSRLMLALKCILARQDQVETVLFDEVDSGIGGRASEALGRKIRELATHHQVLCITHLPQIAAGADEHLLVAKQVKNSRTRTMISTLGAKERVHEVARMLAGETITEQTLAYARELMGGNRE